MGGSIGQWILRGSRCGPTNYDRCGNACSDKGLNDGRVSKMANLTSRRCGIVIVVMPEAHRRCEQKQHQSGAGS